MRLLQFKDIGQSKIKLGLALEDKIIDLSLLPDFSMLHDMKDLIEQYDIFKDKLTQIAKTPPINSSKSYQEIEFLAPVTNANKVICVGFNYLNHAAEFACSKPEYPVLFSRFNSSFVGNQHDIIKHHVSDKWDYEGELVVVIGKQAKAVKPENVNEMIFGYSIFNDISVRDYQKKSSQFFIGKNFDNAGACGPWICTKDELPLYAKGLKLQTFINGKMLQNDITSNMLFPVDNLICTINEVMELHPGDIIVTGTPSGVGCARTPRVYLKSGDKCEIKIEKIGSLVNMIR